MKILESILEEYEDTLNDFQDDVLTQYAWEKDLERTWEQLTDNDGKLTFIQTSKLRKKIDRIFVNEKGVIIKRGIIRKADFYIEIY